MRTSLGYRLLILASLLLQPLVATAAVYKWVDADGVTQYSATPPRGGHAYDELNVRSQQDPRSAQQSRERLQQRIEQQRRSDELKQRTEQRETEDEAASAERSADREQRCAKMRQNLIVLQRRRPVFYVNENGERDYLDDDRRNAEIERLSDALADYCDE